MDAIITIQVVCSKCQTILVVASGYNAAALTPEQIKKLVQRAHWLTDPYKCPKCAD